MDKRWILAAGAAACASWVAACGDDGGDGLEAQRGDFFNNNGGESPSPGQNNTTGNNANNAANNAANNDNSFEPEPEERFNLQRPQPSRNYVFVANTDLDTVARIDGDTLEIKSIEVGDEPTVVRTWQGNNVAAVLNEGSSDVSILHSQGEQVEVVTLPMREGFNQLVIAPGGEYALTYLDYAEYQLGDDLGKFQDVNLIRLREGEEEVFNLAVGFHVLEIEFDEDGQHAYIITEDGVSAVKMDDVRSDRRVQPIAVSDDPREDALAVDREVEITRDGRLALVRTSALQGVNLVPLEGASELLHVPMPGVPTDLDIYPDSGRAVAVLKSSRQVAVLDLAEPDAVADSVRLIDVEEGPVGLAALDFEADLALLYTLSEQVPQVVRLDLDTGAQVVWDVRKSLRGVQMSPSGERAVLFHQQNDTPRSQDPADLFLSRQHAYTLLDLRTGFAKLQTIPTSEGEFVFSPDSEWMFLVLSDEAQDVRQVERVHLESFRVDSYRLGSLPEHLGLLPSENLQRVYISQKHAVGRMTFIDIATGDSRTVTGYELNSQIE